MSAESSFCARVRAAEPPSLINCMLGMYKHHSTMYGLTCDEPCDVLLSVRLLNHQLESEGIPPVASRAPRVVAVADPLNTSGAAWRTAGAGAATKRHPDICAICASPRRVLVPPRTRCIDPLRRPCRLYPMATRPRNLVAGPLLPAAESYPPVVRSLLQTSCCHPRCVPRSALAGAAATGCTRWNHRARK